MTSHEDAVGQARKSLLTRFPRCCFCLEWVCSAGCAAATRSRHCRRLCTISFCRRVECLVSLGLSPWQRNASFSALPLSGGHAPCNLIRLRRSSGVRDRRTDQTMTLELETTICSNASSEDSCCLSTKTESWCWESPQVCPFREFRNFLSFHLCGIWKRGWLSSFSCL